MSQVEWSKTTKVVRRWREIRRLCGECQYDEERLEYR